MTKDEFIAKYDGAALFLEEVAAAAAEVTDDLDLQSAGQDLVEAHESFAGLLELLGVELG